MPAFRAQMQEVRGAFSITPGAPRAWQEGSASWVADRAATAFPGGPTIPFRPTLIFHRKGAAR